ncbi:MAG: hypothetical protein WEB60_06635 [Terrimicrobiaceae bacterium]
MTAVEIINEIRQLTPPEKVQVFRYVRGIDNGLPLSGLELTELASTLAGETNPDKTRALADRIAAGFYGNS